MRQHSCLSEQLLSKRQRIANADKKKGTLVQCWQECKLAQILQEQHQVSQICQKYECHVTLPSHKQWRCKRYVKVVPALPHSLQDYLQNKDMDSTSLFTYLCRMEYHPYIRKQSPAICTTMSTAGGHFVRWSKYCMTLKPPSRRNGRLMSPRE